MIDTLSEELLTLTEAAKLVPRRGRGPCNVSTLYRWTQVGCKGIKLESVQIGGTRCTSRQALGRFFQQLTTAQTGEPAPVRSLAAREKAIGRAEKELTDAGF